MGYLMPKFDSLFKCLIIIKKKRNRRKDYEVERFGFICLPIPFPTRTNIMLSTTLYLFHKYEQSSARLLGWQ